MGQRSQIFVRFYNEKQQREILGLYYGWNFKERMISRARHSIEWILGYKQANCLTSHTLRTKLVRILDTNFDMKDVCISSNLVQEYISMSKCDFSLNECLFNQDNNDGKLLIDIADDVKYAFLDSDNNYLGDGDAYMQWDSRYHEKKWDIPTEWFGKKDIETCKRNIQYLNKKAILLTPEEAHDFLETDYSWQVSDKE